MDYFGSRFLRNRLIKKRIHYSRVERRPGAVGFLKATLARASTGYNSVRKNWGVNSFASSISIYTFHEN